MGPQTRKHVVILDIVLILSTHFRQALLVRDSTDDPSASIAKVELEDGKGEHEALVVVKEKYRASNALVMAEVGRKLSEDAADNSANNAIMVATKETIAEKINSKTRAKRLSHGDMYARRDQITSFNDTNVDEQNTRLNQTKHKDASRVLVLAKDAHSLHRQHSTHSLLETKSLSLSNTNSVTLNFIKAVADTIGLAVSGATLAFLVAGLFVTTSGAVAVPLAVAGVAAGVIGGGISAYEAIMDKTKSKWFKVGKVIFCLSSAVAAVFGGMTVNTDIGTVIGNVGMGIDRIGGTIYNVFEAYLDGQDAAQADKIADKAGATKAMQEGPVLDKTKQHVLDSELHMPTKEDVMPGVLQLLEGSGQNSEVEHRDGYMDSDMTLVLARRQGLLDKPWLAADSKI